jgi:hypothetical protein
VHVALEACPLLPDAGRGFILEELHVGSRSIFEAAGFAEVSRPTVRRVAMCIDFT